MNGESKNQRVRGTPPETENIRYNTEKKITVGWLRLVKSESTDNPLVMVENP